MAEQMTQDSIEIGLMSLRDLVEFLFGKDTFSVSFNYMTGEFNIFTWNGNEKDVHVGGSVPVCFAWLNGVKWGQDEAIENI